MTKENISYKSITAPTNLQNETILPPSKIRKIFMYIIFFYICYQL